MISSSSPFWLGVPPLSFPTFPSSTESTSGASFPRSSTEAEISALFTMLVASFVASTVNVISTVVLAPGAKVPGKLIVAVDPPPDQALSFNVKPAGM